MIRDNYTVPCRFFADKAETATVLWYKVPGDRACLPVASFVAHEPWYDYNGPRSSMFVGQLPWQQGCQYAMLYGGSKTPVPLTERYTGNYCGTRAQWAGDLRTDRPADLGDAGCCGGIMPANSGDGGGEAGGAAVVTVPRPWWSELIDRDPYTPVYSHREVERDPSTGQWSVVIGGRSGTIASGGAWEASSRLGIPVPGTYVQMRPGTSSQPFLFAYDALEQIVAIVGTEPVSLPAGRAYNAVVEIASLSADPPGSQEVTGGFSTSLDCYALDLADADTLEDGAKYNGRLMGSYNGLPIYSIRSAPAATSSPCAGRVYLEFPRTTAADFIATGAGVPCVTYYVYLTLSGDTVVLEWICIGDVCGWLDTCSCVWQPLRWYCTPAGCVAALTEPADSLGGPYATSLECSTACAGVQYWCVLDGGVYSCVAALSEPAGAVSGPYGSPGICDMACGQSYWCVDDTPPYSYWCVSVPDPNPPGTDACSLCPSGAPNVWHGTFDAPPDPYWQPLAGNWDFTWDAISDGANGYCVWSTSPTSEPVYPRWTLIHSTAGTLLLGYLADGAVVTFGATAFYCCDQNVFDFSWAGPADGQSHPWTGPTLHTLDAPASCDPVGTATTTCVQALTEPPDTVGGPYTSAEDCTAVCGSEPPPSGCCPGGMGSTFTATVEDSGIFDGDYPLTWISLDVWVYVITTDWGECTYIPGVPIQVFNFTCDPTHFYLNVAGNPTIYMETTADCDNLIFVFTGVDFSACGGSSNATVTIHT